MKKTVPVLLALLMAGCAVPPSPEEPKPAAPKRVLPKRTGPDIRVGLITGADSVCFSVDGNFSVVQTNGTFIAAGRGGEILKVRRALSEKTVYRLVAASMSGCDGARRKVEVLDSLGLGTSIEPVTNPSDTASPANGPSSFRVYLKPVFNTYEEAKAFQNAVRDRLETFISTEHQKREDGPYVLVNAATGESWVLSGAVRIRGANVTIIGVPVGSGYHWARTEDLTYPETIEIQAPPDGRITVINVVPLETYLKGVVPSEMHPGFPFEALKAQAVAARSRVLRYLQNGLHSGTSFDFCDEVHCQVYSGLSRRSPAADLAVDETAGRVLEYGGRVCDAVFHGLCGGHGEDGEKAWGGFTPYLKGNPDGSGMRRYGRLSDEKAVRKWIDSEPPVWCNTASRSVFRFMEYTKKYFRWRTVIPRSAVESNLAQKGYPEVGTVLDLVPESRGVSGRILRLRIVGTRGNAVVAGELTVRKVLSSETLWSSCFYVEKAAVVDGVPGEFVLHGAGWGHGVGMCQTGAAAMALKGKRCESILRHYYRGARLKRMY